MRCEHCKEHTATIHLTEINSGQRQETHLCEECAQKQGLAIKNQIPLNELLSNLLAVHSEAELESSADEAMAGVACPNCGMTLKQFRKESLLGCPHDYEVFGETLRLLIEKSQAGQIRHCGKVPSKTPADTKGQIELANLQRELDAVVKAEDYEKAASIRDRIEQLK